MATDVTNSISENNFHVHDTIVDAENEVCKSNNIDEYLSDCSISSNAEDKLENVATNLNTGDNLAVIHNGINNNEASENSEDSGAVTNQTEEDTTHLETPEDSPEQNFGHPTTENNTVEEYNKNSTSKCTTKCSSEKLESTDHLKECNKETLKNGISNDIVDAEDLQLYEISDISTVCFSDGQISQFDKLLQCKPIVSSMFLKLSEKLKSDEIDEILSSHESHHALLNIMSGKINELETENETLKSSNESFQMQAKQFSDKLQGHDIAAKRTIYNLQQDHEKKIKEMHKRCTALENDQQSAVMNYARREKELLDLKHRKDDAENFARNAAKEREKAVGQLKAVKNDMFRVKSNLDKKESELHATKQEVEKLKEEVNSQIIKARWAQNKLKTEVDGHKETKEKCEKMIKEIQHAKEETEQIRMNCQDMIKTYQESEEIKSNALDIELKETVKQLSERKSQHEDLQEVLKQKSEELSMLKIKHKDVFEENTMLKSKIESLDEERVKNEQCLRGYEDIMNKQKLNTSQLSEKVETMTLLEDQLNVTTTKLNTIENDINDAFTKRDIAVEDLQRKEQREQELLEFTAKLSSKNSELAVQVEELKDLTKQQCADLNVAHSKITVLEADLTALTAADEMTKRESSKSRAEMGSRLEEKEKTICELLLQMEDLKDDLRTQKRKTAAAVKDLTRQLNQAKRKMDNTDAASFSSGRNSGQQSADAGSLGSRTSSTTSLDKICPSSSPDVQYTAQNSVYESVVVPETSVTSPNSLDRQLLIERIVRLQQIHAKKNEKIDFLTEHVQQLVQEMQRKQRLIQHYIMREEVGSLAPPKTNQDHHHRQRMGLTLELSMEINQKMQSVLEDTLLKNITLKESLETLGKEVQRLACSENKVS